MTNIWIIAKRELRTFFDSLIAYILLVVFLVLTGSLTWIFGTDVFLSRVASLRQFFYWSQFILMIFVPALTMRMIAEERNTGTMELLLTRAVSDWQIVAGKYLGGLMMILITLAFTLPYYFALSWLGPVDHGAIFGGYLGLILLSSAYLGIGIFASSLTNNQIVAFLLALVLTAIFGLLLSIMAGELSGDFGEFIQVLSIQSHFESIQRGVIDLRDVVYFLSVTLLGLVLAEMQLVRRNILA
jgi:ABC-2 type transport system permease protein